MQYRILVDKPPLEVSLADLDELVPGLFSADQPLEPEAPKTARNGNSPPNISDRVTRYLDKCDPAISGQRGHDTTFRVLCQVINGFDLSPEKAREAARYYNQKCEPPWSEKELKHKVDDALKATSNEPRGHLLESENETPLSRKLKEEQAQREESLSSEDLAKDSLRPMPSWIAYGNRQIDRSQYHVGEGFLEIGGYVMLIGQSYVGKSTFITQLSICLAIGRSWLFFKLERALRVMVVQAEDPGNKLIKMGHMFKRMGLSNEELRLADQNTAVLTIRDLQDASAIAEIDRHALVFNPDVIVINPMTSYLGGSVYKDEAINAFLRVRLTPLLDRLKASAIVVHHPPKPIISDKELKDLTAFELQYGGAGMAALTNAPRGNMFLTHVDGDVFKLQVGKGFNDLGTTESVAYLRQSEDQDGVMLWERCESEKAEEATEKEAKRKAKKRSDPFVPFDRLLKCFLPTQKYPRTKVIELSKKELGKGRDWTDDAIKQLVFDKKLAKTEEPNPKGQPHVFYHLPTVLEPAEETA